MLKGKKIVIPEYIEYLDKILKYISETENMEFKYEDLYEKVTKNKFKQNLGKHEKYDESDPKNPSLLILSEKGHYHYQSLFLKSLEYLKDEGYLAVKNQMITITAKGLSKIHFQNFSSDYKVQHTKNKESSTNLRYINTQAFMFWFLLLLSVLTLVSTIVDIHLKLDPVEIPTKQKNHKHNCTYQAKSKKQNTENKDSVKVVNSPLK